MCEFSFRSWSYDKVTSAVCFYFSVLHCVCSNAGQYEYFFFCFFFLAHILFSALVGVFGGFLGCRLYRLGVFTIGECLGLVSSTQSFSRSIGSELLFTSASKTLQSDSRCTTFLWIWVWFARQWPCKRISVSYDRLCTKNRFETELKATPKWPICARLYCCWFRNSKTQFCK